MISINKPNVVTQEEQTKLRFDWNSLISDEMNPKFTDYSEKYFPTADTLVTYLKDFQKIHKLNIKYNSKVISVNKKGETFVVKTNNKENEEFEAKIVVGAHGLSKPYIPNIKGIENCINYIDFDVDGNLFKNKNVAILGKGNSAFETSKWLLEISNITYLISPNELRLASNNIM